MPKFTEQEKEHIHQSLMEKGRELFIQYGLAKTSIDDIIQACGIAKGSFYKFFQSKEELYFEILKNEEEVRETVLNELFRENLPPKELLTSFFHTSFKFVEDNPFLQRVFQNDEHERLTRKLPQQMMEFTKWQTQRGIDAIQILMERGVLPQENPKVIVGVIQAIMMLRLHKEEIGTDLFPKVMDKLIDYVTIGLTK
ncbi:MULTISPECIES: TetR/AcrR family transcriptional regulator [Priestia]|uniref:TetR/AcrR family transcriptional regulator n=1 Tax=Priestia TaxID=2800373 RepID=UPI001AD992AE|nr:MULTISPECIES: TetR/AcrR family transcriptional regulator [Priestia]QTL52294.1 TetR/AcrR family transcriptional regulator [Priestia aryabhattai]USL45155.1 TetR/AcrR family transcriptional regulator [Priestia megaterium]